MTSQAVATSSARSTSSSRIPLWEQLCLGVRPLPALPPNSPSSPVKAMPAISAPKSPLPCAAMQRGKPRPTIPVSISKTICARNTRTFFRIDKKTGVSGAQRAGFDADEIARMEGFTRGTDTPGRNLLRWGAETAGGGGGIGFLGAAAAGGAGGAYATDDMRWAGALGLPLAGLALRTGGNRLAMRNMQQLDEMLRQRNPLYQERLATSGMQPGAGSPGLAQGTRDAIATEIVKQQSPTRVVIDTPSNEWE